MKRIKPPGVIIFHDGTVGSCCLAFLQWIEDNEHCFYLNWNEPNEIYLLHWAKRCRHTWTPDKGSMTSQ
jgi:hypothetical protein